MKQLFVLFKKLVQDDTPSNNSTKYEFQRCWRALDQYLSGAPDCAIDNCEELDEDSEKVIKINRTPSSRLLSKPQNQQVIVWSKTKIWF